MASTSRVYMLYLPVFLWGAQDVFNSPLYMCIIEKIRSTLYVLPRFMRSAAGGSSGDGGVDVKMLAEQNVQLKEALKRLHSHSIAEKTDVSVLVWTRVLPSRTT